MQATLLVAYDPKGREIKPPPRESGIKTATLTLPEGLEGRDIYDIARRLAELLLEQV